MALYRTSKAASVVSDAAAKLAAWIDANPGGAAADCATACGVPVEVVFAFLEQHPVYDDLPTTSDQFHMRRARR